MRKPATAGRYAATPAVDAYMQDLLGWEREPAPYDRDPALNRRINERFQAMVLELLAAHDESVAAAVLALRQTNDAHLATSWKLLVGGRVVIEMPRYNMIADTLTHLAHHRGQLTVYLRLIGAAVPSIYGPSADEGQF